LTLKTMNQNYKNASIFTFLLLMTLAGISLSCKTPPEKKPDTVSQGFFEAIFVKGEDRESFRVLITSDRYEIIQTDHRETIQRDDDPGGDRYICDELRKYDKFDETREGMYHVSLYPDRGTLRKVRPFKPLNLIELDNLVLEDIQRWSFKFPKKVIQPNSFYVKYRIVLRKRQTDEQIIKEVQKRMMREE
jgi:hypothetical protein